MGNCFRSCLISCFKKNDVTDIVLYHPTAPDEIAAKICLSNKNKLLFCSLYDHGRLMSNTHYDEDGKRTGREMQFDVIYFDHFGKQQKAKRMIRYFENDIQIGDTLFYH